MMTKWIAGIATAATVTLGAASGQASVVFFDSFEIGDPVSSWKVFPDGYGDWTSTVGAGIEIQTSGTVVDAQDGDQYVELDSDESNGGGGNTNTNSSMTRIVDEGLTAGWYELSFYYQPRTSTLGDNTIDVYLAGDSSPDLFETLLGTADDARDANTDWVEYSFEFYVDGTDNDYAITFIAGGTENTLGGFIDSVTLAAIPLPGSFLLMAGALGAFGVARRRRKAG